MPFGITKLTLALRGRKENKGLHVGVKERRQREEVSGVWRMLYNGPSSVFSPCAVCAACVAVFTLSSPAASVSA